MRSWIRRQDEAIALGIERYSALGQDISRALSAEAGHWPIGRVAPVMWWEWPRFVSRVESTSRLLQASPITIVLWNAAMGATLASRSRADLLAGNTLLSSLYRIALGLTCPDEEEGLLTRLYWINTIRYNRYVRAVNVRLRHFTTHSRSVFADTL
jgi:hypothetical protein